MNVFSNLLGGLLNKVSLSGPLLMGLSLTFSLPLCAAPNQEFWKIATPEALPFDEQIVSQKEEGGVVWKQFYFTSEIYKGEKFRIYSIYAAPKGAKKLPTVLFIHGAGGTADATVVKEWADRGYACLSIDWWGNPKDETLNREQYSKFGASTDLERTKFMFVSPPQDSRAYHALIAERRAISWLQGQSEVDPSRIGIEGVSWGGIQSLILSGIDDRVKSTVTVYGSGFFTEFGINGGAFGVTGPLKFLPVEQQKEWLAHFDPQHYVPRIKNPLFLMTGTNDIFIWLPLVKRTYQALPGEKRLWLEPNINHKLNFGPATAKWFDIQLRGKTEKLPVLSEVAVADGHTTFSVPTAPEAVKTAKLNFVRFKSKPPISAYASKDTVWETVEAKRDAQGLWQAALPPAPAGTTWLSIYASAETTDGVTVSSVFNEFEAVPSAAGAAVPQVAPVVEGNLFVDGSFEAGAPIRGKSGELYINVVGEPKWDNSNTQARTGKAALGVTDKNSLAIGVPATAGKHYLLSGYFKSDVEGRKARLQINWKRADNSLIKYDLKTPPLNTAYQKVEIAVDAPAEVASATVLISGGSGADMVWLDDAFYGETP